MADRDRLARRAWIDGGQTRTYSFVFPRMDVDTVTFQVASGITFDTDFRLLDVPVTDHASPTAGG